jgi:hypothetical protein
MEIRPKSSCAGAGRCPSVAAFPAGGSGIVLLENDGGPLKATRIVDYFRDQSELDHAYGWGLRWVAGSKD